LPIWNERGGRWWPILDFAGSEKNSWKKSLKKVGPKTWDERCWWLEDKKY